MAPRVQCFNTKFTITGAAPSARGGAWSPRSSRPVKTQQPTDLESPTNVPTVKSLSRKMEDDLIQVATSLNEIQVSDLKAQLQKNLMSKDSAVKISHEDMNDLIDYAVAMVMNKKTINYIINELKTEELLDSKSADHLGLSLEQYLKELLPKSGVQQNTENVETAAVTADSRRMISLKSRSENALAKHGALGVSREGRAKLPRDESNKKIDYVRHNDDRQDIDTNPRFRKGRGYSQERLPQRQDIGGRGDIGRKLNDSARQVSGRGFPQHSDRGQTDSSGGRGHSQRPGQGRGSVERHQGSDAKASKQNTRDEQRNAGRGQGLDEKNRLRRNPAEPGSTRERPDSAVRNMERRATNHDGQSYRQDKNHQFVPKGRESIDHSATDGSYRTAKKRTAPDSIADGPGDSSTVNDGAAKMNNDPTSITHTGNDRQAFNNRRGTRGGRFDFRSGRGRGQHGSDNRVGNMVQGNINYNATTADGPSFMNQTSKKARSSADVETSLNPSSFSGDADNNQEVSMEGQEEVYQQPYGYEYYDESQWYMENPYYATNTYHWGRGGRGFGRGMSFRGRSFRPGGRGGQGATATTGSDPSSNEEAQQHQTSSGAVVDESTLAAAAVSPSPLVTAAFSDQTGFSYRGRGRGGRGRGGPDRAEVTAMVASKTWSRTKAAVETVAP